jgi:hypothetical protein
VPNSPLPETIAALVDALTALPGAIAVVLGGSRGGGTGDAGSDWDLCVYYRREIDLDALTAYGTVHAPGSWGRLMNGGAWLTYGGEKVDVLLRDLNVVEHWLHRAQSGEFEVDALLGYLAGIPTYSLCAELALCHRLHGDLPPPPVFPEPLALAGSAHWRFSSTFSLMYARMHARRGNLAGTVGQASKALMEAAHALACERGQWELNEKRLVSQVGLDPVQARFGQVPQDPPGLCQWVDTVAADLGITG